MYNTDRGNNIPFATFTPVSAIDGNDMKNPMNYALFVIH